MYEARRHPPLSHRAFRRRVANHALAAAGIVVASLGIGMAGYARTENLTWLDAFLNAAMLLGGMGPVHIPVTDRGKLFAGVYALYCGMVFLVIAGLILAPLVHRLLHRFHWQDDSG
jgi:hypothetical protein